MRRYNAPFWESVKIARGCWEWQGSRQAFGHGNKWHNGKSQLTHRISWELIRGPIPDGLCVLHKCDNPPCVRPSHLFLGTNADNNADMDAKGRRVPGNRGKTHCKRGHEFTPENTHTDRHGKRSCRSCRAAAMDAFYLRRRSASAEVRP